MIPLPNWTGFTNQPTGGKLYIDIDVTLYYSQDYSNNMEKS